MSRTLLREGKEGDGMNQPCREEGCNRYALGSGWCGLHTEPEGLRTYEDDEQAEANFTSLIDPRLFIETLTTEIFNGMVEDGLLVFRDPEVE
jgi:hypothetical protein